jgi:ribosomal protein S12 methylthiotransferase accessory factor
VSTKAEPGGSARAAASKTFYRGTHRLIAPEQTLERVRGLLPVMGITRIANVTGLDTVGIPVVMVSRPNSRSIAVSQGKGLDLDAAKASGVMESIEGYHAERITLPLKLGSHEELRYTHRVVDVTELLKRADSLFHPNLQLLWIEGHDLLGGQGVWLPYEMVHLNYTLPLPPGTGCFAASSSGLASGNHALEAISHAVCEVVERDATVLWHLRDEQTRRGSRVDLGTVDDPGCRELLDKFERAGVEVGAWNIMSDVPIPAFLSVIAERTPNPLRPLPSAVGYGCHPARHIALARALAEAAQSRLTLIAGSRDDIHRGEYDYVFSRDVQDRERKLLQVDAPMADFHNVPTFGGGTFEEDLSWELQQLRNAGVEQVIVIDLTKSELRIPVVRVVIPGLEPRVPRATYLPGPRARALMEKRP